MNDRFLIGEFAQRAGVTIRTLRHYDRIGLLKPVTQRESGYRVYDDGSLLRLQHIVTLKALGFTLKEISKTLDAPNYRVQAAVVMQIAMLEARRGKIDVAIAGLKAMHEEIDNGRQPRWETIGHIIKAMICMNDMNFTKYYTPEQLQELESRKLSPEEQYRTTTEWQSLISAILGERNSDPSASNLQRLLKKWDELLGQFTQGDQALSSSLTALYSDASNISMLEQTLPGIGEAANIIAAARKHAK